MKTGIPCCLCGRRLKGIRTFFLHLINAHADAGFRLEREDHDHSTAAFRCTCGMKLEFPEDDWHPHRGRFTAADHVWNRGGLKRHLFALLLDESNDRYVKTDERGLA